MPGKYYLDEVHGHPFVEANCSFCLVDVLDHFVQVSSTLQGPSTFFYPRGLSGTLSFGPGILFAED